MLGVNQPDLALLTAADAGRVLDDIAAFGFDYVRFEVPWLLVQPAKAAAAWGATTWQGKAVCGVAGVRDLAAARGITLLPTLGVHMPTWKWTADDFGTFVSAADALLAAPVYEVLNEPNLATFTPSYWSKASYTVPLLKAARAATKGSGARLVFPGLAAIVTWTSWALVPGAGWFGLPGLVQYHNDAPETYLHDALTIDGCSESFDFMGYHPYSLTNQQTEDPNVVANQPMIARTATLAAIAGRPMWGTEWGFSASLPDAVRAARTTALWALIKDSYAQTFYMAWRDAGAGANYGLVDANNVPRPLVSAAVRDILTG